MQKRGISSIIAIVLIILVITFIVTLIWIFILPTIKQPLINQFIKPLITIDTASGYTAYDSIKQIACVQVKRGEDNSEISKLQITFFVNGSTFYYLVPAPEKNDSLPEQNEEKTYCFDLAGKGIPNKIVVAPIFLDNTLGSPIQAEIKTNELTQTPAQDELYNDTYLNLPLLGGGSGSQGHSENGNGNFQSLCGDSLCDGNETINSCPIDCRIDYSAQIMLLHVIYTNNLQSLTHYFLNGSKEIINGTTNQNKIKSFLKDNLDLYINGNITGKEKSIFLRYVFMEGIWASDSQFSFIDSDETAFVHSGEITKQNRIRGRCAGNYSDLGNVLYISYPSISWGKFLENYSKRILNNDTRVDGIFFDNTLTNSSMIVSGQFWKYISNESQIVETDGKTIVASFRVHTPSTWYSCQNNISVMLNGQKLAIQSYNDTSIILQDSLAPRTRVNISYFSLVNLNASDILSWNSDITSNLDYLHSSLGSKLTIINGLLPLEESFSLTFTNHSDGGMTEGFIYAPWTSNSSEISEASWIEEVNSLKDVSKKKIFLAYSGVDRDSHSEDLLQKRAMFAFTSFLLGKEKYSYFDFTTNPGGTERYTYFDYWNLDIGSPLEDYHFNEAFGVYEREFEDALILVNPKNSPSGKIILGKDYEKIDGSIINSSMLSSKEGIILKKK